MTQILTLVTTVCILIQSLLFYIAVKKWIVFIVSMRLRDRLPSRLALPLSASTLAASAAQSFDPTTG
jgi:hypothetical protein